MPLTYVDIVSTMKNDFSDGFVNNVADVKCHFHAIKPEQICHADFLTCVTVLYSNSCL